MYGSNIFVERPPYLLTNLLRPLSCALLIIYYGKFQNSIEMFSLSVLIVYASFSDSGVNSNFRPVQIGHFSKYALLDKIDAHQKPELQIKNSAS
jgi:hypothetical protein